MLKTGALRTSNRNFLGCGFLCWFLDDGDFVGGEVVSLLHFMLKLPASQISFAIDLNLPNPSSVYTALFDSKMGMFLAYSANSCF